MSVGFKCDAQFLVRVGIERKFFQSYTGHPTLHLSVPINHEQSAYRSNQNAAMIRESGRQSRKNVQFPPVP
jgi:hypothetical protein